MPLGNAEAARLSARPGSGDRPAKAPGTWALGSGQARDGLLSVPTGYDPVHPAPLLVLLHGAGGDAARMLARLEPALDRSGILVLVPESRGPTWDVLLGGYGPDVRFIDAALETIFATFAVDPARVAIGGFSDGASYALSLGLINGDLFTHILAFSPGFVVPAPPHGDPRLFISHGTDDRILPIAMCSRTFAPILEQSGYDVLYREFDGPHTVPTEIAREALDWFIGDPGSASA